MTDTYIQMAKVYGAIALCRAKLPFQRTGQRDEDERHDHDRKNRVRSQDGEVYGPHDALTSETRDTGTQHQM